MTVVTELEKRSAVLKELSPWPEINYMVDESWARIHAYGSEASAGQTVELELRIFNHAPKRMAYQVKWHAPEGWTPVDGGGRVEIDARREGTIRGRFRAGGAGLHVVTADVSFDGRELKQWTEALVRVR